MSGTPAGLFRSRAILLPAGRSRSGRSVAGLIREAIRKTVLKSAAEGPVAIWDGEPQRTSIEHDSIYDEN